MADAYDLVVIGGGPGGYVAAIRAAQLGMKTACVEKRGSLGGTCLNVGCIPSKALLQSSEKYESARHDLASHGIMASGIDLDLGAMMARKDKVVTDLTRGIEFLLRKNKVDYLAGTGTITGPGAVSVALTDGGSQAMATRNILIATGSDSATLPGITVDEKTIVSSTGALSLGTVPAHLVVIGGGYIGLEMGSVWSRLGAKVTVIEFLDRIVPGMDSDIGAEFHKILKKQGFQFKLRTRVTGAETTGDGVRLSLEPAAGGAAETLDCDVVLVAIGRVPHTAGLGLDTVGVATDERGRITVDDHFRTSVDGIFAIGDVIAGPMLAHKAEEEGIACVELMAGHKGHVNYTVIPGIVYTHPEVAAVGKTEDELKRDGIAVTVGKFPFLANSRAKASGLGSAGFVKVIADATTDRVLGVHIIGPDAGTMIHECCIAMEFGASAEDIYRTCHGHPTLNEAVKEAAMAVHGRPIHI